MPDMNVLGQWPSTEQRRRRALCLCIFTILILSVALWYLGKPPRCAKSIESKVRHPNFGYEEMMKDVRSMTSLIGGFVIMHLLDVANKRSQGRIDEAETHVESINVDAQIQLCFF